MSRWLTTKVMEGTWWCRWHRVDVVEAEQGDDGDAREMCRRALAIVEERLVIDWWNGCVVKSRRYCPFIRGGEEELGRPSQRVERGPEVSKSSTKAGRSTIRGPHESSIATGVVGIGVEMGV